MSAFEISKQHQKQKYKKFLSKFDQVFKHVFPNRTYSTDWLQKKYGSGMNVILSHLNPIRDTIKEIYGLVPEKRISNQETLDRCKTLISWNWSKKDLLPIIGGPILYQGIYAISGSPEAHRVLKVSRKKNFPEETATNVAWDFFILDLSRN
jgi:hypothetical protein